MRTRNKNHFDGVISFEAQKEKRIMVWFSKLEHLTIQLIWWTYFKMYCSNWVIATFSSDFWQNSFRNISSFMFCLCFHEIEQSHVYIFRTIFSNSCRELAIVFSRNTVLNLLYIDKLENKNIFHHIFLKKRKKMNKYRAVHLTNI